MKTLQMYQAADKSMFDSEIDCINYEDMISSVDKIMSVLNKKPIDKHCRFANGEGFIKQNRVLVEKAKSELVSLANKYFKTNYGFGFIRRVMCDSDNKALYAAWSRLSCIDDAGREWGQPHYAANPTKGIQKHFKD